MKLTLFTFGTYGDVRPYIALGKALQKAGYTVQIATAEKYRALIEEAGLPFYPVFGDPDEMTASFGDVTDGGSPLDNLRFLRDLLPKIGADLVMGTQDSDAIISNYNMSHIAGSIAEKHHIQLIEVGLVPMLPTADYPNPHILSQPPQWFPSAMNRLTYSPVDLLLWLPFRGAINHWRQAIGLSPYGWKSPFTALRQQNTPRLEAYSQHIVPRASDWGEHIHLTGFWFLDEPDWIPPDDLIQFLDAGEPPIYIGFGSMNFGNSAERTRIIQDASQGQRLILTKGWGGISEDDLSDNIFVIDFAPHGWLFPRTAGVIHHGGAGTVASALRAGVPQAIVSFYGDQPFWGNRIYQLGLGPKNLPRKALTVATLSERIHVLRSDASLHNHAQKMRDLIVQEDGINNAVQAIRKLIG